MLRLRPYKNCDAEKIVSWIKDERTLHRWSADRYGSFPITAEDINVHYAEQANEDNYYTFSAFDETGVVGHMMMRFLDEEKTDLRFGFVIVDDSKRGKGYGKEMLKLAITYALEILKVSRISIVVFEDNTLAYQCYKSIGFVEAGEEYNSTCHLMGEDWKGIELEIRR